MTSVLTTDHPAWHAYDNGARARAVRTASGIWYLAREEGGLHVACVHGTEDVKPTIVTTDPARVPGAAPAVLRTGLHALGVS
ncbi:hypothetical protein [Streptomyces chiangmaiensis]|uniref:Uncharacterized protein n=1 Tax=Streptomyces chiangmaiensis TaxID=766497 RepID=A0ABU7FUC8_9ACTN|nr:hypothetical protein [Streptomyces chiangmaiensis]MED7827500.1 hypothetical protein [Streptomyces chiangmaiensis]